MTSVNASFAKLLEYEQRALGLDVASDGAVNKGDWAALAFRIGEDRLVCGVGRILESLPLPPVTRVPGTKPFILGLANVRGDLVTIIDLGCFLSGRRSATTMRSRLLSATLRGRPVGLMVDEVFGQRNFMEQEAESPPQAADSALEGWLTRQHRAGKETWLEFNLDALFESAEFLDGESA
jgi:twitching motility protein PilI